MRPTEGTEADGAPDRSEAPFPSLSEETASRLQQTLDIASEPVSAPYAPRRMTRALLVYNPVAGERWKRPPPASVLDALAREGVRAELRMTRGQDHATEIVREHLVGGLDEVWVCGGDGSVAQAATALVDSAVPLCILPTGTGNVVAVEYGITRGWRHTLRALARSSAHGSLHTFRVGSRAVLLGVGVGFDARIIGGATERAKDWLGFAAFAARGVLEWARYDFPALRVEGEDEEGRPFTGEATHLFAAVTRHYGGTMVAAPRADPGDDCVDLVLFRGRSRLRLAALWAGVELPGTMHLRVPGVETRRARRLRVTSVDGRPVAVHLNGDAVERTPVEVEPWGRVRLRLPER